MEVSEIIKLYIDFKADPSNDERADSYFCTTFQVSLPALAAAKAASLNWAENTLELRRKKYSQLTQEVDQALLAKARAGDTRAAELWYKRFDRWDPKESSKNYETFADLVKAALLDDKSNGSEVPSEEMPEGSGLVRPAFVGGEAVEQAEGDHRVGEGLS